MIEKRTSSARARLGFTLAELLIVTGIVSILVAVSIPIMSGQVQKAKEVRAKAEARILCTALWMYLHDLDEVGSHPESWVNISELCVHKAQAHSDTGHVCVNSNRGRMSYKESLVKPCFFLYNETVKQSVWK